MAKLNRDREEKITHLQSKLAVASFVVGTAIALLCLFAVPPLGAMTETAIAIVSEFLILCGALLGIKVGFDLKLRKFETRMRQLGEIEDKTEEE